MEGLESAFRSELAAWRDYYLGTMSAAAAPAGLVFVALSLRPAVLADENLRTHRRAASVFARFVVVATLSALLLVPALRPELLGGELTVAFAASLALFIRGVRLAGAPPRAFLLPAPTYLVAFASCAALIGGEPTLGLYGVGLATGVFLIGAFIAAWALLAEIRRS